MAKDLRSVGGSSKAIKLCPSDKHKIAYWPEKKLYYCQYCDLEMEKKEYEKGKELVST